MSSITTAGLLGFAHPFGGLDHILAMTAVGVWGVLARGRALWLWPLAFVATMLVGFIVATLGWQLPWVGAAIASSTVVLALAVALAVRAPVWAGVALVGLFALFHGHAHGTETITANLFAYGAGLALGTGVLHTVGIGLGVVVERSTGRVGVRALGAAALLGGVALLGN